MDTNSSTEKSMSNMILFNTVLNFAFSRFNFKIYGGQTIEYLNARVKDSLCIH
jgi:hypothetical protein